MSSYSSFYSTSYDTTAVSIFGVLYYGSLAVLVIFLILVAVHFTMFPIFALTANDPGIIVVSGTSDRELAYTSSDNNTPVPANARNKKLPKTTLPDICNYTIGVDVWVDDTKRVNHLEPIFYRDKKPVGLTDASTVTTEASLASKYSSTNIIAWTTGDTKQLNVTLIGISEQKSMTTPLPTDNKKWFRLTVVLADSFAEVYINGSLKSTINMPSGLKQIQNTDFYPPVIDGGGITIANMAMWPRLLSSKEIRTFESAPMSTVAPAPAPV